ncbi:MAG TPA: hypothetical protein VFT58_06910, partial [Nitrososphaera sp.]|nr:hypothetical protein [Nitrososphaera sp.]
GRHQLHPARTANTTGIVVVAALAGRPVGVPVATMTLTRFRARSAAGFATDSSVMTYKLHAFRRTR